jgi:2-polyprenylphenol 6-hydroxylase
MLTALSLQQKGFSPHLWRGPKHTSKLDTKRVFALNHASVAFLKQLGVTQVQMVPIKSMYIWDGLSGASVVLKATDKHKTALAYIVDEALLWELIYQALLEKNIPLYEHVLGASPLLEDGVWRLNEDDSASLLCIAEGAQSLLRESLNIPCDRDDYQQLGIVAEVVCDRPHQGVAYQVFTPHGPLAFLPLLNPMHYSIVWSLDVDLAEHHVKLSADDFLEQLNLTIAGQVGHCLQVSARHAFPLKMVHTQAYYGKNWLLLGDSAHHFHPLAGLGLNAGIADIIALSQFENPFSHANLARYARERRAKISLLILGLKALKHGFANSDAWWVTLRSFGMDIINHERILKKWMMSMVDEV